MTRTKPPATHQPPTALSPMATASNSPSQQENPRTSTLKESSSDSELSSVSRMMDATSSLRFKQYLNPGPLESSVEMDQELPELSIDLTERDGDNIKVQSKHPALLNRI